MTVIAAANMRISHDKSQNIGKILEFMEEAARKKVDFLVFPEVALQGYADFAFPLGDPRAAKQKQYYASSAEPIPGPTTDMLREKSAECHMLIQVGLAERSAHGNVIFNSTALISPEGVVGVYRKVHNQFEFPYFNPGESTPVFDLPLARVGCLICYDLAFPELIRTYALQGATIASMSTAWPMQGHDVSNDYYGQSMDLAAQSNAFFNQMWVIVSNHCEIDAYSGGIDYWGNSQIIDPWGRVVARLGREEGLVAHTADIAESVTMSRTEGFFGLNLLQDRRPEHYTSVVDRSFYAPPVRPPR